MTFTDFFSFPEEDIISIEHDEELEKLNWIMSRIKNGELTPELIMEIQHNCRLNGINKTFVEDLSNLDNGQIGSKIMNNVLFCAVRYIIRLARNYCDAIMENYILVTEVEKLKLEIVELKMAQIQN